MNKEKTERKLRNKLDREWIEKVRKEFDNKCIICGDSRLVHTHHLFPRELKLLRHLVLNWYVLNIINIVMKYQLIKTQLIF